EHLDAWDDVDAHPHAEWTLQAPVQREVLVVLPVPVPAAIVAVQHAGRRGDRLRRSSLDADVRARVHRLESCVVRVTVDFAAAGSFIPGARLQSGQAAWRGVQGTIRPRTRRRRGWPAR